MRRAYKWDEGGRVYEVEETWHKGESLGGVVIREDGDGAEYDAESMETLVAVLLALREARPPIEDAVLSYNWANGEASALSSDNGGAVLMSWHGDEVVLSRQGVENVLAAIALLYPPEPAEPEWREWMVGDPIPDAEYVAIMLRGNGIEYRYVDEPYWGECGDRTITHWRPLDVPEPADAAEPAEPAKPKWHEWAPGDPVPDVECVAVRLLNGHTSVAMTENLWWEECGAATVTHWCPMDVPEVPE